jgi:hypothetical protein
MDAGRPEPLLDALLSVTLTAPRIASVAEAYVAWLGYRVTAEGEVTPALAADWQAPQAAGSPWIELSAPSGGRSEADCVLRLVERPAVEGFTPLRHHGWNANEMLCQDPDALAARFALPGSPFRVIGPPAPLASNPRIVALQALGPAGEIDYFTRLPPEGGSLIKTPARTAVDRSFIVVLGGPSISAMTAFYRDTLGQTVSPVFEAPVDVLNSAQGLPAGQATPMALVALSPAYALELDEYPGTATSRPQHAGDLPPGIAMIGLRATSALPHTLPWQTAPRLRTDDEPHAGRRTGLLIGAAGERLEIVEGVRETR